MVSISIYFFKFNILSDNEQTHTHTHTSKHTHHIFITVIKAVNTVSSSKLCVRSLELLTSSHLYSLTSTFPPPYPQLLATTTPALPSASFTSTSFGFMNTRAAVVLCWFLSSFTYLSSGSLTSLQISLFSSFFRMTE